MPLRIFIQEVLKRSRTTYSTLQTALFYLFRSKPDIQLHLSNNNNNNNKWEDAYISCGRRMFLASLVVASKFVQDKTYRNSAWAKIAGLPVNEINAAERIFLNIINYRLYISQPTFEQWHHLLHLHVEAKTLNQPTTIKDFSSLSFQPIDLFYKQQQQQQQHSFYLLQHQKENITPYHHHQHMNNNNSHSHSSNSSSSSNYSPTTPPYHTTNNGNHGHGWTIVLSPTTFLPTGANNNSIKKRQHHYNHPPSLSMSLPSSINSSPMQTPTQISPVRINGSTSVFNWASTTTITTTTTSTTSPSLPVTSFDQNHHRSIINTNNNKKRKYNHIIVEPTRSSYNISNVRQQQSSTSTPSLKRFHYS